MTNQGSASGMISPPHAAHNSLPEQAGRAGQIAVPLPQCQISFSVRRQNLEFERLLQLTWLDEYYWENKHAVQKLGFRFASALDPTITVQSLKLTIDAYPVVGSRIVQDNGKAKFHFDAESVSLRFVNVEPEMLNEMEHLEQICEVLRKPHADQKQNPLFTAFLFRSLDPGNGSVLICGFQHCVGDATSYALVMTHWSECYERLCMGALQPDLDMPSEVFTRATCRALGLKPRSERSLPTDMTIMQFPLSDQDLQRVKEEVLREQMLLGCSGGGSMTANDVLCAQCAVALAPSRFLQEGAAGDLNAEVRIFMLVDARGSDNARVWGNYATDIAVDFVWHELLDQSIANVAVVARKIRNTLAAVLPLTRNVAQYDNIRADRRKIPKLFTWNSWARAGHSLRQVRFRTAATPPGPHLGEVENPPPASSARSERADLEEMRWFNSTWGADPQVVIVEPLRCLNPEAGDPRLVVYVAASQAGAVAEAANLSRFWTRSGLPAPQSRCC